MKTLKCEDCLLYKSMNCPNSKLCYERKDKPFFRQEKKIKKRGVKVK